MIRQKPRAEKGKIMQNQNTINDNDMRIKPNYCKTERSEHKQYPNENVTNNVAIPVIHLMCLHQ